MLALLVALLSVPVASSSALADDATGTTQTEPATADPAPSDPAAADPAPTVSDPVVAPTTTPPKTSSNIKAPTTADPATSDGTTTAGGPSPCGAMDSKGNLDLFQQHLTALPTGANPAADWINGALNNTNSNYAEGDFVPQRAVFSNLPAGDNTFSFTYDMTKNDTYAYDFADHLALVGAPAGSTVSWDAPAGTPPVPLPSYDNADGTATVLVHVTIHMTALGGATLRWDGHIARELDYGPGMGAGSISGAPYHFSSDLLNCASAGQHDNQLMADSVHYATITIIKDAQPNDPQDFDFTIVPGGAASTFKLDDDGNNPVPPIPAGQLPNTVTFRVPPNADYTVTESNTGGWTNTAINCVDTGFNVSTTHVQQSNVVIHTADSADPKDPTLQGTSVCTFVNSKVASVVVDKIWNINHADYTLAQVAADPELAALQLSAQLQIGGSNQGWGVPRSTFFAGDSTTVNESTTIGNTLCTLDRSAVTLDHGSAVDVTIPPVFNTGPLAGGSNAYTITNFVTCKARVTLVKSVSNGPQVGHEDIWTLSANDGGSGADLSGPTGTSGQIQADTDYTLSEDNADPRYDLTGWACTNGVTVSNGKINVGKGVSTTCTATNKTAKLVLIKHVVNDNGGTATAADFNVGFTPGGGNATTSGPGVESPGTTYWVNPGTTYTVSETGLPTYTQTSLVCTGSNDNQVTPAPGSETTCTITNDDIPSAFLVTKSAVENDGVQDGFVMPGSTITYTVTVTKVGDGVPVLNIHVTDDQSDLLDDAHLISAVVTSAGTSAEYDINNPNLLLWSIPSLDNDNTPVTMTYTFQVNGDAYGRHLRNVATAPGSLPCPQNAPKCNETNQDTPHFTLIKSSNKPTGVMPGELITYTLTVHNDSDAPMTGAVVTDELLGVMAHATALESPGDTPGWPSLISGSTLTWQVPTLAKEGDPGDTATLVYTFKVKDHEWNVDIDNLATPGPGGTCPVLADCTTHHETPPVTTFVVKKVDFETGAPLAGAHFQLWIDKGVIGVLEPAVDVKVGPEEITGADGLASWDELLADHYLVQETQAPPGYGLPDVTVLPVDLTGDWFDHDWNLDPFIFEDPSIGHLVIVAKQQYTKNANGDWVKRPDKMTADFGEQVRYVVKMAATGTKLFHNVKLTDYVPGFDPEDTHQFSNGSTLKASLVPGTAKCFGSITCTVSVSPSHLITWNVGTVKNQSGSVEFVVVFPKAPSPLPTDSEGNGSFKGSLWNVATLSYDSVVSDIVGPRTQSLPMHHTDLKSNDVLAQASVFIQKPPGIVPCRVRCLPNTGSAPYLLQLGALGGLVLLAGSALLVRGRRRGEATG